MKNPVEIFIHTTNEFIVERQNYKQRIEELHQDYADAMKKLAETAVDSGRYQSRLNDVDVTRDRWLEAVDDSKEMFLMTRTRHLKTRDIAMSYLDRKLEKLC